MNLRKIIGLILILPFVIFIAPMTVLFYGVLGILAFPFVLGISLYKDDINCLSYVYGGIFECMIFPFGLLKND